jgi:CRISPR/Cas system type I-B associated protein Csh2 (Cas7 group RAMP superfamily)
MVIAVVQYAVYINTKKKNVTTSKRSDGTYKMAVYWKDHSQWRQRL